MKKKVLTAVLLAMAFAMLVCSCVSTGRGEEQIEKAVKEGDYYLFLFRQYEYREINGKAPNIFIPEKGAAIAPQGSIVAVRMPWWLVDDAKLRAFRDNERKNGYVNTETPSEQHIDRAIAAYEAALKLDRTGTYNGNKGAVHVRLERANGMKQKWLTEGKPQAELRKKGY